MEFNCKLNTDNLKLTCKFIGNIKNNYFTIKKSNGILIYSNFKQYESRNSSGYWLIKKADEIYNWPDFNEIVIITEDSTNEQNLKDNVFTYKTFPDFNFHCWKEVQIFDYEETCNKMIQNSFENPEQMKVGWLGSITHPNRQKMVSIGSKNTDIFDFSVINWQRDNPDVLSANNYISMEDLVKKYGILIDVEGAGYSARVKYLLWSRRPLLLIDRIHTEYYYDFLEPWVHYIPVKQDMSDLVEKTRWCIDNYDIANEIANNAYIFAQTYLTREACYNQINKIIQKFIK